MTVPREPSLVTRPDLVGALREHSGRVAAALVGMTGDFSAAEDLVQDAVEAALRQWPETGIPERPDAWLYTVARNRGLDARRRDANYRSKLAHVDWSQPPRADRLGLIFTCCHPALGQEAQIALTLRVVCGLTTAQIARAFLVPETTVAQRITRAKRKITDAAIPYRMPEPNDLNGRLQQVLAVVYLVFNEGYMATALSSPSSQLVEDAEWVAAELDTLMPTEPEVAGLLALIRLHRARAKARWAADGSLVLLADQDRSRWDHGAIAGAERLLVRAAAHKQPGPYQLQAAIVACHAQAPSFEATDWAQIVVLYDMLLRLAPSPVTRLHRAIALRYATAPQAALDEIADLAQQLDRYHLFHATRAELLRATGHPYQARLADQRALELTDNPAEQAVLRDRLSWA